MLLQTQSESSRCLAFSMRSFSTYIKKEDLFQPFILDIAITKSENTNVHLFHCFMVSLCRVKCDDNYFKMAMTLSFQFPACSLFVTFSISFNSTACSSHSIPCKLQSTVPTVFEFLQNFLFYKTPSLCLGPSQHSVQSFPGVKRPGLESSHSPPSSSEVTNRRTQASNHRYNLNVCIGKYLPLLLRLAQWHNLMSAGRALSRLQRP